jgi:hypothetical protein
MRVKEAIYGEIESRNRPSFFATPVAWAVADFTRMLIEDEGGILPQHTGMIVVSDECSLGTIGELSLTAARGSVSPLRFAGSSPSIVVGLPALQQGIRGPTLCLTMMPQHASGAILAMIDHWTGYGNVVAVIVVAHHRQGDGRHLFKGLIARSAGDETSDDVLRLSDPEPGSHASHGSVRQTIGAGS